MPGFIVGNSNNLVYEGLHGPRVVRATERGERARRHVSQRRVLRPRQPRHRHGALRDARAQAQRQRPAHAL